MRSDDDDVRRLLGALAEHDRSDPPQLPDDVAARLDAQLTDLGREREHEPVATVVPLRRRVRRRVRPSLAAAAAVVLVAGGGGFVAAGLLTGDSGDEASSVAGGSAAEAPASDEDAPQLAGPESAVEGGDSLRTPPGPEELEPADLAEQVQRLVAEGTLRLDPDAAGQRGQSAQVRSGGCMPPDLEGVLLRVRYDAELATLVVGGIDGGTREVRVYSCSGDQVLGRTQVSADLVPR